MSIIEHVDNPRSFLACCSRLLKDNAILVIGTANYDGIYRKVTRRFWMMYGLGHVYFFNPDNLSILAKQEGLRLVKVWSTHSDIWRWINYPVYYSRLMLVRVLKKLGVKEQAKDMVKRLKSAFSWNKEGHTVSHSDCQVSA